MKTVSTLIVGDAVIMMIIVGVGKGFGSKHWRVNTWIEKTNMRRRLVKSA